MSIAYGIRVKDSDDPYISNAEEALKGLADAGIPGTYMVDFIPLLKHIPSWFPGATFQTKAKRWNEINKQVYQKPFEYVESLMVRPDFANTVYFTSDIFRYDRKKGPKFRV